LDHKTVDRRANIIKWVVGKQQEQNALDIRFLRRYIHNYVIIVCDFINRFIN